MSTPDPWNNLRRFTDARIGLGRSGAAQPTREVLDFTFAHAMARDAVTTPLDWAPIEGQASELGLETMRVASAAESRGEYLRRPDLGRQLSHSARQALLQHQDLRPDLLIVVGDGLSSKAVAANFQPFLAAFLPHVRDKNWRLGPVILASEARVALGDDAAEALGAKAVVMLIGERPGLSSPDSLGAYLTYQPRTGRKDADRNCISNIRARGLSYDEAAFKLAWLIEHAFKRGLTGVALKDEADYGGYLAVRSAKQIT